MPPDVASDAPPPKAIIGLATCWGTRFGGINSFNFDLLANVRLLCPPEIRILCIVLNAEKDAATASPSGVEILSLNRPNDRLFLPSFLQEVLRVLYAVEWTPQIDTVWVGHDRITGQIAVAAAEQTETRSAVIHHMSYAHYEAYADGAQQAAAKVKEQRGIFTRSNVVLAVGPTLQGALSDMVGRDISTIVPGLPEIVAAQVPHTFTGFLSGRIAADTKRIKQAHLGVAGFADAIRRANADSALPDSLQSRNEPALLVRGLGADQPPEGGSADAETDLNYFSEKYAERVFNLRALPFTTSREALFDELRRASVALMPSWHEGFGLVAWEAIGAGVPLIISTKSGVYRLLEESDGGLYRTLVHPIDVRGKVDEPYFRDEDLKDVSDAVIHVAKNPKAARADAARLREALFNKGFTWQECARDFLSAIGMGVPAPAIPQRDPVPLVDVVSVQNALPIEDALELPAPQWTDGRGLSISRLLRAEEEIIPFDPRRLPFLADQVSWVESHEFPIALRLLVGAGGVGKTRLCLELCQLLREKGWWAGFLPDGKGNSSQLNTVISRLRKETEPTLIVIDYAETRRSDLLGLIKPLVTADLQHRVRVLLLARSGGEWWDRLQGADPVCETLFAGRATSGPFEVPPLYDTLPAREAAFTIATQVFARKLGISAPKSIPDLSAAYYGQPLLVQIAAMMALHGEHAQSAEGLTRSLLHHEQRYWDSLFAGSSATADQAAQLMALSTLANGLQIPRLIEPIWKRAEFGTTAELRLAFNQLKSLYPGKGGLEGLRPDLLGEALVTQVLLSSSGMSLLNAVLSEGNQRLRHNAWTVFARLLRNRADVMPLLHSAMTARYSNNALIAAEVSCQTPSPLPQVLEDAFDELTENVKLQVAGQLASLLLDDLLPLNGLAFRVSKMLVKHARRKVEKLPSQNNLTRLAGELSSLCIDLHRVGNDSEALGVATEATILWNRLATDSPGRYEAELANSLINYGNFLNENGRIEEAIVPSQQAVDILERLARQHPKRFEAEWATALGNHSNNLSKNGRLEEALTSAKEALDIRKRLATTDPDNFEPDLGTSLINYGNRLGEHGRLDEALAAAKNAAELYQRLAEKRPELFEADWATALTNYANHLSDFGRVDDALEAAKHGLEINERLAKSKPERFEKDWAISLNNYSVYLSEQGRFDEAVAAAEEASRIFAHLTRKLPLLFAARKWIAILHRDLLLWLKRAEGAPAATTESPRPDGNLSREWMGALLFENCVYACLTGDWQERVQFARRVLTEWEAFDAPMRRKWETCYFLAAVILEGSPKELRITASISDWRTRYSVMVKRRDGHVPAWLQAASVRLGVSLPT